MLQKEKLFDMWGRIDTVLLDMDGTLLDKHFDDYFWETLVPEKYAAKYHLPLDRAKSKLLELYKSREGTLEWTDLDFWSTELGLDVPALKYQVNHLIQVHPYVEKFLGYCRQQGKKVVMVTNAHSKTLEIKLAKTAIGKYFDEIFCSEVIGLAKEQEEFWQRLQKSLGFAKERTMLADDTKAVLETAERFGIGYLVYVARASSKEEGSHAEQYISIRYFKELIPQ